MRAARAGGQARARACDKCNMTPVEHVCGWTSTRRPCQGDSLKDAGGGADGAVARRARRIHEHIRKWGVPPSRSELPKSLGLAFPSAVNYHLRALERSGWIPSEPGHGSGNPAAPRGHWCSNPDELPAVAAGTPILADESKASFRPAGRTAQRTHPRAEFYLVVRGDSMCSIGYKSGDILGVRRNREPRDGDIVIARIATEITVKCFRRIDDILQGANCSCGPGIASTDQA